MGGRARGAIAMVVAVVVATGAAASADEPPVPAPDAAAPVTTPEAGAASEPSAREPSARELEVAPIAPPSARRELRVRYVRDVPITLGLTVLWVLGETAAKDALSPAACRWCDDNAVDRSVRDSLRWSDVALAKRLSDVAAFGLTPLAGAGGLVVLARREHRGTVADDLLIVAEAAAIATDLNYLIKIAVGRERPDVHALPEADKPRTDRPSENNLSFNSGHSTSSMAIAVAAGTSASLRGYRHAWAVWATAVPMSMAAGYLRVAGDRHWASDVVTGWALGAAVGFAVPYFLHGRAPDRPQLVVDRSAGATTVGLAGAW